LENYIRIPNSSPMFAPDWEKSGETEAVISLFSSWVAAQGIAGLTLEVMRAPGRTPLLFLELPASGGGSGTVMLYGHLDKQPPMTAAWSAGLAPYEPVVRDGKLYGRGGADDGYALFGAVTALAALRAQGAAHGRAVIMIEASEESGAPDLPPNVTARAPRLVATEVNFGLYPMATDQSRIARRFYEEAPAVDAVRTRAGEALDADAALALGLVTAAPDDIDWADEVRIAIEERAAMSPDALTGLEANLRFNGPETMATRIFGRLTAWQNWIFQRPNAVGDKGALKVYGKGEKAAFDWNRV
jgi:hypothetical protein